MNRDHSLCCVILTVAMMGCSLLPTRQTACSNDRPCPSGQRCNPTTSICEPVESQPDLSLLTDFAAPLDLSATPQGMVYVPGGTFMMGDNLVPYAQPVHQQAVAAFYLDTQGKVIDRQIISIGTLDASLVHPREVFEPAVSLRAASIIVAHNHPSGNLEPSREDIEITKQLVEAGKILNIQIIDHVIITKIGFTSTKKKGIIS